jgi:hypothetical protein
MIEFEQLPEPGEPALKPHHYPDYIRVCTLVIFCLLGLSLFFGKNYIRSVIALHQAEKDYDAGDFVAAKQNYYTALDYCPTSEDLRIGMAVTCFSNKDTADDEEGLSYLYDIHLTGRDWNKISPRLPEKFRSFFQNSNQQ